MQADSANNSQFLRGTMHFLGFWGFAIAQPLFSALGPSPEFFVAHKFGPFHMLAFGIMIAIGLPLMLASGVGLIGVLVPKSRMLVSSGATYMLILIGALGFLNLAVGFNAYISIFLAIGAAIAGTLFYWQSAEFRGFFTFLAPAALFFPIYFLFFSPASALVLVDPASDVLKDPVQDPVLPQFDAKVPIVLVILDELAASSLLNKDNEIDAIRFPNFAAVANQAHWFPNAISAHERTAKAVPAILTGLAPIRKKLLPPSNSGYPNNIFKWLGPSYQMNILESVTSLCPPKFCESEEDRSAINIGLLIQDLFVVFGHVVVPPPYVNKLPRLDEDWKGFAKTKDIHKIFAGMFLARDQSGRRADFDRFIAAVQSENSTFDFIHALLPHSQYKLGADFRHQGERTPELQVGESYLDDVYLTSYSQLLYLHQVSAVDSLIGKLVAKLKEIGKYDDALVIITADHGVAFEPGTTRRGLIALNAAELLNVPLLVKLPGQVSSVVNERIVSNLDTVATIADVIGETPTWENHGKSMLSDDYSVKNIIYDFAFSDSHIDVSELSVKIGEKLPARNPASHPDLSDATVSTIYDKFLGGSIEDLPILDSDAIVISRDLQFLDNVDLESEFLPILFRGEIKNLAADNEAQWVAVSLNGKIAAFSPLYDGSDDNAKTFRAALPPNQIREGQNALKYFLVESSGAGPTFIRLASRPR